jgi:hypothetical protein
MAERSARDLRKFGLTVGGIFLLLGTLSRWRGHHTPPLVFWTVGTALVVPGAVAPRILGPVERGWMRFAEVLGHFNARVILTVIYYLVVTPIGIVMRRFRDPLDRTLVDGRASEWLPRATEPVDRARYREQF